MRQLPIRLRVAAAFALAMALVLAGSGLFIYASVGGDLARALDQDLRLRAQDLAIVVRQPGGSLATESGRRLVEHGESFAELLDTRGKVLDSTAPIGPARFCRRTTSTGRFRRRSSSTAPRSRV